MLSGPNDRPRKVFYPKWGTLAYTRPNDLRSIFSALCVPGMGMILWGESPLCKYWEKAMKGNLDKTLAEGKGKGVT